MKTETKKIQNIEEAIAYLTDNEHDKFLEMIIAGYAHESGVSKDDYSEYRESFLTGEQCENITASDRSTILDLANTMKTLSSSLDFYKDYFKEHGKK